MGGGKYRIPAVLAHLETMPASQLHPAFTAATAQDFAHLRDVHNIPPVDADEVVSIECVRQLLDGFTQHESPRANVQASVVVGGFDPFNFIHIDEGISGAIGHDKAARIEIG